MMNKKIESIWEILFENPDIELMKKHDYTNFIKNYSFIVPSFETRDIFLTKFVDKISNYNEEEVQEIAQYTIGVFISTMNISELSFFSERIKFCLNYIYSFFETKTFLFLDYILSKDWGKFVYIINSTNNNKEHIAKALKSKYYVRSDEFAALILKVHSSKNGRSVLSHLSCNKINYPLLFSLLDVLHGKTAGLIRDVYFSIRREPILGEKENPNDPDIIYYLQITSLSDLNAYSAVMIALRCMQIDFYKLYKELIKVQPNVASMLVSTIGAPYLIWSNMQVKLINKNVIKNNKSAVDKKSLESFYESLVHAYTQENIKGFNTNNSKTKVGIIITTYKPNLNIFRLSIKSILEQSHRNLTVCIIDDCNSNDVSTEIKELILNLHDNRIMLVRNNQNIGQYASRNKAISLMDDCSYYAIQDDDDISHFQRIDFQLKSLKQSEGKLIMCQQVRFDNDMRYIPDKINPYDFDYSPASSMFQSSVIKDVGGFANVRSRGDVEFISRIKKQYGNKSIVKLSIPLYIMRCDINTVSASKDRLLKTQLDVFRSVMGSKSQSLYLNGQQHALFT